MTPGFQLALWLILLAGIALQFAGAVLALYVAPKFIEPPSRGTMSEWVIASPTFTLPTYSGKTRQELSATSAMVVLGGPTVFSVMSTDGFVDRAEAKAVAVSDEDVEMKGTLRIVSKDTLAIEAHFARGGGDVYSAWIISQEPPKW